MPIQAPSNQRIGVVKTQSEGQINYQAPNVASTVVATGNAIAGAVNTVATQVEKVQRNAADTKATQLVSEFTMYGTNLLEGQGGLKYVDGYPTPHLAEYDKKITQKMEDYDNDENLDAYTKEALKSKLPNARLGLATRANTITGSLYNKYETRVADSAVELTKREMGHAVEIIDIKDPKSFANFDYAIAQILDTRYNQGRKDGRVETIVDPVTGKVVEEKVSKSLDLQIAKDRSDGIFQAIDLLNKSGKSEEAKVMIEKYDQYLDPVNKKKLLGGNQTAATKSTATKVFMDFIEMPAADAREAAQERLAKEPEVMMEVLKMINTNDIQRKNAKATAAKDNFDNMLKYTLEKQRSGAPWVSVDNMWDDTKMGMCKDKITGSQMKSLESLIKAPTNSNFGSVQEAMRLLQNEEARGMSYSEWIEKTPSLSKEDRNKWDRRFEDLNLETPGENSRRFRYMQQNIESQLIAAGVIKKNKYGKYTSKMEEQIADYKNELADQSDKLPPGSGMKEWTDFTRQFVASKVEDKTFVYKGRNMAPPASERQPTPTPTPTATPVPADSASFSQSKAMSKIARQTAYKRATKLPGVPTDADLEAWEKGQGNGAN